MTCKENQIEKHARNEYSSLRIIYRGNEVKECESSERIMKNRRSNGRQNGNLVRGLKLKKFPLFRVVGKEVVCLK
jgi:hypothetical protein